MGRKALFTIVFTIYGFIFFNAGVFLLRAFLPWALDPEEITGEVFTVLTGFFLIIVVLAWLGASFMVYGKLSDQDSPDRQDRL